MFQQMMEIFGCLHLTPSTYKVHFVNHWILLQFQPRMYLFAIHIQFLLSLSEKKSPTKFDEKELFSCFSATALHQTIDWKEIRLGINLWIEHMRKKFSYKDFELCLTFMHATLIFSWRNQMKASKRSLNVILMKEICSLWSGNSGIYEKKMKIFVKFWKYL